MKNVLGLLFVLFLSLSGRAGIQDSIGVTKLNGKLHLQYMVSPGETIYGISTKYGVPLTDLFEINPELENGLKVGQVIHIPYNPDAMPKPASGAGRPANAITYKVQPGDTYYGIAKKNNISVEQLLKMNNMDLKAGQEIVIGYGAPSTTPSVTPTPVPTPTPTPAVTTATTQPPVQPNIAVNDLAPPFNDPGTPYAYDSTRQQILVIPFDPYLYFSDADDEIAAKSNMQRTKVREVFRRRLNTLLTYHGYETIHLLGGSVKDSISDLNKIYSSVTYAYQQSINNPNSMEAQQKVTPPTSGSTTGKKNSIIKNITGNNTSPSTYEVPVDQGKFFGVLVKNPDFFTYFNTKYGVDYYVFINQFEVKTNYQNCLDRAALNYERTFTVHYSIFDSTGKLIAGDKFKVHYNSNNCYVYQIVSDNMPKVAQKIINQLPPPVVK
ncbi:MAG: LysM peptidoglycan-binding domain-containing protein [Cytophagaceae bacterium]|jgi:LysM repeat protein|nr:LysM peptidoglycan-binding domain-containing protein [Cytophagaceae bacterium]